MSKLPKILITVRTDKPDALFRVWREVNGSAFNPVLLACALDTDISVMNLETGEVQQFFPDRKPNKLPWYRRLFK